MLDLKFYKYAHQRDSLHEGDNALQMIRGGGGGGDGLGKEPSMKQKLFSITE